MTLREILNEVWNELYPALIIYGIVLGGAWTLIFLDKQFNFFS